MRIKRKGKQHLKHNDVSGISIWLFSLFLNRIPAVSNAHIFSAVKVKNNPAYNKLMEKTTKYQVNQHPLQDVLRKRMKKI
jgi:hypothetical protein